MTQLQLLEKLAEVGLGLLFWMCLVFPVIISVAWPWWKTAWGRNIVSLEMALALTLCAGILNEEFGVTESYALNWVTVGGLYAAVGIVLWRTVLVLRTQWRSRKGGKPGDGPPA